MPASLPSAIRPSSASAPMRRRCYCRQASYPGSEFPAPSRLLALRPSLIGYPTLRLARRVFCAGDAGLSAHTRVGRHLSRIAGSAGPDPSGSAIPLYVLGRSALVRRLLRPDRALGVDRADARRALAVPSGARGDPAGRGDGSLGRHKYAASEARLFRRQRRARRPCRRHLHSAHLRRHAQRSFLRSLDPGHPDRPRRRDGPARRRPRRRGDPGAGRQSDGGLVRRDLRRLTTRLRVGVDGRRGGDAARLA